MGLDMAVLVATRKIDVASIVSGDSDLIPAVQFVKNSGVITYLVHGPSRTYHTDLWGEVDERMEITHDVINGILLNKWRRPPHGSPSLRPKGKPGVSDQGM